MKPNLRYLLGWCCVALLSTTTQGQDYIFSQPQATSFAYNPALTGHIPSTYRLTAQAKSQWNDIDGGYKNALVAADFNRFAISSNNAGLGLVVSQEQSMGGRVRISSALLSGAYHICLDRDRKHYLSIGMQGGLLSRRFNTIGLQFESGMLGGADEVIASPAVTHFDLRAGAHWTSYLSERVELYFGAAVLHLGTPDERFVSELSYVEPALVVHGRMKYMPRSKVELWPQLFIVTQGGSRWMQFGGDVRYRLDGSSLVTAGVDYRWRDALVARAGVKYGRMLAQLSYDFTTSSMMMANGIRGGFELSLVFEGQVARTRYAEDLKANDYFKVVPRD